MPQNSGILSIFVLDCKPAEQSAALIALASIKSAQKALNKD